MILEAFSYQGVEVGGFERAKEVRNVITGKDWSTTEHLRANNMEKAMNAASAMTNLAMASFSSSHQSDEEQVNNVLC